MKNASSHWILDKDGNEVETDLMTWAAWFEKSGNRRIDRTEVGDYHVSTVFLGLDHNFGDEGRPLLYETMVFENAESEIERPSVGDFPASKMQINKSLDEYSERYSTRAEAEAGHKRIVAAVGNDHDPV